MKSSSRSTGFKLATLVLASCLGLSLASGQDYSKRIRSKIKHSLAGLLNPHISPINVLLIDGKAFEHVRGFKPFYLGVPGTNAVVFVSDEKDYSVNYHVYDMDRREDLAIHERGTMFGNSIGETPCSDTVEMTNGTIVLCTIRRGARSTLPELADLATVKNLYYLDLRRRIVSAEKDLYYDRKGTVILERNYPAP